MFSFRSINNSAIIQSQPPQIRNEISFSLYHRKTLVSTIPDKLPPVLPPVSPVPKLKWGEPIWNLFHVLAHKIIPEHFFKIRSEIFEIIRMICYNLPCPDCANHAREYIGKVNFSSIITTEHLKDMFFIFHNTVNQRKQFPIFPREQLDARYESMNIKQVLSVFLMHFRDKHRSSRMLADDLFRGKLANKIEKWFSENNHYFQY